MTRQQHRPLRRSAVDVRTDADRHPIDLHRHRVTIGDAQPGCISGVDLDERIIGARGLVILSKLTGVFLASLAAQIVFTGVCGFLGLNAA